MMSQMQAPIYSYNNPEIYYQNVFQLTIDNFGNFYFCQRTCYSNLEQILGSHNFVVDSQFPHSVKKITFNKRERERIMKLAKFANNFFSNIALIATRNNLSVQPNYEVAGDPNPLK